VIHYPKLEVCLFLYLGSLYRKSVLRSKMRYTEPRAELIKAMSLLKRNALAAPFEKAFALQKQLEANPPAQDAVAVKQDLMSVHYR
jgi:hypothetical protein